jgi:osmotically-inducible protein OsmY
MRTLKILSSFILAISLSSCASVLIGAGGEGASIAAQERSAGAAVDDTSIVLKIKNQYLQNDYTDHFANNEVKSIEGRVLLTGNVDKPDSQIEGVRLAWQVNGVKEVINEIQVNDKSGIGNYARDVWISAQIRTRLLFEKHIRSVNYSTNTVNQTVYLMGIAQDQEELDRATNIASTTSYVEKVVSYVRLKNDPRRAVNAIN